MIKLFDNHPIVLDRCLATILGLNEAIILQQVHYWLEINKKNKRNFHEGRYWTYNTIKKWQEEFPFWSLETVKRTFKKLREANLIITGNFNVYKMDRTLWYTINYEELEKLCNFKLDSIDFAFDESKDGVSYDVENINGNVHNAQNIGSDRIKDNTQNDQMKDSKKPLAIPDITTEISSDIFNQSVNQSKKIQTDNAFSYSKNDRRNDNKDKSHKFKENFKKIIDRCELYGIDSKYREGVTHAIKLILLDIENSKFIRIGDNNVPVEIVEEDMKKLNFFIIDHAVNKFKRASKEIELRNTMAYLKACIYNSIHEIDMDIDSELMYEGLID